MCVCWLHIFSVWLLVPNKNWALASNTTLLDRNKNKIRKSGVNSSQEKQWRSFISACTRGLRQASCHLLLTDVHKWQIYILQSQIRSSPRHILGNVLFSPHISHNNGPFTALPLFWNNMQHHNHLLYLLPV